MLNFRITRSGDESLYDKDYDVVIVGGGPAGLVAGLYAARAGLNTILVEKSVAGGQMATTERVDNCPGCIEGSGAEIGEWMRRQATGFGLKWANAEVLSMNLLADVKMVLTSEGRLRAPVVILATGARPRKLGVPGEDQFWGRGVSVCATCDGPFMEGKVAAAVGGGDSAVKESDYLTRFAEKVHVLHRRDQLRADRANTERALSNPKIDVRYNVVVERVLGEDRVRGVQIRNVLTGEMEELPVDGVFVWIGMIPNTDLFTGQLALDDWGYVVTDARMATSAPGVFAVGDVRAGATRQIVTAAADGAVAALGADEYLHKRTERGLVSPGVEG
ncbi:MAG: thioredoxin-disulfide reductase [Chloroflexi bacterium]|nr:thioredoxin-disulfide reductase [Chloroflexota bacterium]MCL5109162.1 thioredoxin-disulfide reductase [Chloroflexota bacterium]